MPTSTLNSQGFDTGSNYQFGDKMLRGQYPRSLFDLSHLSTMTIANAGIVFPISLWRTVPTDEFDISVRSLIRVLPQVVPLYSRQRLYVYGFYSRNGDLWENWNVFARRGQTGNVIKTVPTLNSSNVYLYAPANVSLQPNSLGDYLGLPIGASLDSVTSSHFSALPFMMYMRIWRDYFLNRNFYSLNSTFNSILFPDNDDRFRLGDDGNILSFADNNYRCLFRVTQSGFVYGYAQGSSYGQFGLFSHEYPDDYFTSALPFQQRGEAPTLDLGTVTMNISNLTLSSVLTNSTDLLRSVYTGTSDDVVGNLSGDSVRGTGLAIRYKGPLIDGDSILSAANGRFKTWLESSSIATAPTSTTLSGSAQSTITLNSLRELTIAQIELERMARTDGSYAEFGQAFFGITPKNAIDYKPVYIGGTYTSLSFTEVLQTSASTSSSALGQYAGHGIGADNRGYLGHIKCDDYGYIMILGCIMPDVYYSQGVERHWTELSQQDMLLPDRAKLGMQPILNQEIYLQDYTVVDTDGNPVNENLWAYQDIFDDYRYMQNRIHGQIADPTKRSFYPYTQSRYFDSLPNWGSSFSMASNVRKDYLSSPSEDAYTAQFSIDVRAVRPLPYKAIPLQFGV